MADNKNDPVVVEDPVVDVNDNNDSSISESKNNNVKYITIGASVVISLLVYFFIFSSSNNEDTVVDTKAIIKETTTSSVNKPTIDNIDNIVDVGYSGDTYISRESKEVLELPELPKLPDTITENIEKEIEKIKKKEETKNGFSKEEVDDMINNKLKSFENEMNRLRDESQKLAEELERKRKEEEEESKKKKSKVPILNIGNKEDTSSPTPPIGDNMPPELSKDVIAAIDEQKQQEEREIQIAQRRRIMAERQGSPMFKMQGGGGGNGNEDEANSIIITSKDSLEPIKETKVDVVTTKTPDMARTVMQGKMINAVLETAINTGIQTQVRAIVSRDVYSELGKNIVIPKGSKIVGNFQTMSGNNMSRIQIIWTRIIRVDGLSININANSADTLGRGGINGELDNKYDIAIKNTFLSSLISIASAVIVDKVTNTVNTTTTSAGITGTNTTTTSTAGSQAIIDATKNMTDKVQEIADSASEATPVILVPQGTKIIVVVGQDMVLPIYKQRD